jgi:anti-sigma regulatory factor (Ser/Thr protein kinase)
VLSDPHLAQTDGMSAMTRETSLPRRADAGARARRVLTRWFQDDLEPTELSGLKLICSELVNNAVVHGRGTIELRADLNDDRVLIEVVDEGGGFEHVAHKVPFEQLTGRGLLIVDAGASRWGMHEGTTHVWAEVERAGPRVGREAKPDS